MKMIEELKANLLCIIGELYSLLARGSSAAQDAILNCISGAILILYVLAQKLGYSCNEVDDDMSKKLKIGINEGHSYEKEGKNLSKLQNKQIKSHKRSPFKPQSLRAVGQSISKIGACPVEYRHEIISNNHNATFCQIT